jgi:transcriptional regulator with XRE-family HTH domain
MPRWELSTGHIVRAASASVSDDGGKEQPAMRTTLGEQVRTHRLRRGLTQARLAHLIGRSERWLIDVERGGVDPRLSDVLALARVLRVVVDDLINASAATVRQAGRPPPRPPVLSGRWRVFPRQLPTSRHIGDSKCTLRYDVIRRQLAQLA